MCFKIEKVGITCPNAKDDLCVNPHNHPEKLIVGWFDVTDHQIYAPCKLALTSGHEIDRQYLAALGIRVVKSPKSPMVAEGEFVFDMYRCFYRKGLESHGKKNIESRAIQTRNVRAEKLPELFLGMNPDYALCTYCRRAQTLLIQGPKIVSGFEQ